MFPICTRHLARLFAVSTAVIFVSAVHASSGLSLSEALARALRSNPDLQVYPYEQRAVEADKLQAGLRANPELGVTLENFGGTGATRGAKSLETTLTLSQLIELGDKRERRVEVADAALRGAEIGYSIARLDALAETTRRYVDVAEAQAQLEVAQRAINLAQQAGVSVEKRIHAGAVSTAERNRASIALLRAQLDLQRVQGELDARRVALSAMWGQSVPDFTTVAGDLNEIPPLADFASFVAKFKTSPNFARFATERRLRESELRLAQAEAVPNLTVGAGLRRLEADSANGGSGAGYGLVASLSLPLPVFNRNQGAIAAAQARIGQSDAERDASFLRSRVVLYGLYQAAVQARRQSTALRGEALIEAEQALTLTQRGFANGRFSFLELTDAQRQVLELREQAITASADAQRLDAEIERLTAQPIVAATTTSGVTP